MTLDSLAPASRSALRHLLLLTATTAAHGFAGLATGPPQQQRRSCYVPPEQLLPPSRVPGFIFHQTERTADNGTNPCFGGEALCFDNNTRDFDLLGYKYSSTAAGQ